MSLSGDRHGFFGSPVPPSTFAPPPEAFATQPHLRSPLPPPPGPWPTPGPIRPRRLGFLARFKIGLSLVWTCFPVLVKAPLLLLVPLASLVVAGAVVGAAIYAMGGPMAFLTGGEALVAIKGFVFALVVLLIDTFARAVVVNGATSVLWSEPLNLAASCRRAVKRLPDLAVLALLFAVQRAISAKVRDINFVGGFLASLFNKAWEFATCLAVPVILFEEQGAVSSIKRSAQLARDRWASQLVAMGALGTAITMLSLPLFVIAVAVGFLVGLWAGVAMAAITMIGLFALSETLTGILCAAMYRYATSGEVGIGFEEADMWVMTDGSPPPPTPEVVGKRRRPPA